MRYKVPPSPPPPMHYNAGSTLIIPVLSYQPVRLHRLTGRYDNEPNAGVNNILHTGTMNLTTVHSYVFLLLGPDPLAPDRMQDL
jgi:hypothetical protein